MIGGVTRHMLPHLPGVPHLHVNRPLTIVSSSYVTEAIMTLHVMYYRPLIGWVNGVMNYKWLVLINKKNTK